MIIPKSITKGRLLTATIFGCFILLYYFNTSVISHHSQQQHFYDQWLEAREVEFRDFERHQPDIRMLLSSNNSSFNFAWELDSKTYDKPDNFLGILQLVKTAKLFDSTLSSVDSSDPSLLEFSIESSSMEFHTQISKKDISSDIRLQNFVKLFEVYASEKRQPVEASENQ